MFQLIVAVISIALVAALAIASIFYGGEAWKESSEKSAVSQLLSQSQQISAALDVYFAEGNPKFENTNGATNDQNVLNALVSGKYLASIPTPPKQVGHTNSNWSFYTADSGPLDGKPILSLWLNEVAHDSSFCEKIEKQSNGMAGCADQGGGNSAFNYRTSKEIWGNFVGYP